MPHLVYKQIIVEEDEESKESKESKRISPMTAAIPRAPGAPGAPAPGDIVVPELPEFPERVGIGVTLELLELLLVLLCQTEVLELQTEVLQLLELLLVAAWSAEKGDTKSEKIFSMRTHFCVALNGLRKRSYWY